ncbi:MAG: phage holin family protein [Kofleriaceae bacterium]
MGMLLVKLGVRLVAFTLVFWFAAKKNPKIVVSPRWALPLVAAVFALLNTGLYWLLKPVLNLATLGMMAMLMPLIVNGALLGLTLRIVARRWRRRAATTEAAGKGQDKRKTERPPWLRIDGIFATMWLAVVLTLAHGALWVAMDYLPAKL